MFSNDQVIPLCIPNLGGNEMQYVEQALKEGWVSSIGPNVRKFEELFAAYVGTKYAVACVSGTAALHISLIVCGVMPGDEVLAPNLTFVAPINAIRYANAIPVFMDSDWASFGIDVNKLYSFIQEETRFENGFTYNKKTGRCIRAIVPMHALGYPVDMDPLLKICEERNITVIEDATESLGAEYKGVRTGNFSKVACFSFNGNKIMTTGGGGMIVTNDAALAQRAKHLTTQAKRDPLEYDHDEIGYNYRLVDILAALGIAQLEQMDKFVAAKRDNHAYYKSQIDHIPGFELHAEAPNARSNYWFYSLVRDEEHPLKVMDIVHKLLEIKIQTRPIWRLMNSLPMFSEFQSYHCDVSQEIFDRVISLPCSTHLTWPEIDRVCTALKTLS